MRFVYIGYELRRRRGKREFIVGRGVGAPGEYAGNSQSIFLSCKIKNSRNCYVPTAYIVYSVIF
jgi:hypothetical protein